MTNERTPEIDGAAIDDRSGRRSSRRRVNERADGCIQMSEELLCVCAPYISRAYHISGRSADDAPVALARRTPGVSRVGIRARPLAGCVSDGFRGVSRSDCWVAGAALLRPRMKRHLGRCSSEAERTSARLRRAARRRSTSRSSRATTASRAGCKAKGSSAAPPTRRGPANGRRGLRSFLLTVNT